MGTNNDPAWTWEKIIEVIGLERIKSALDISTSHACNLNSRGRIPTKHMPQLWDAGLLRELPPEAFLEAEIQYFRDRENEKRNPKLPGLEARA